MSKYINTEKLIAEIERFSAIEYGGNTFGDDVANGALYYVLEEIIPSLQQEQSSLPDNLDEAARSYSESDEPLYSPGHRYHWDNDSLFGKQIETTFKAGAEWMAKQMNNE